MNRNQVVPVAALTFALRLVFAAPLEVAGQECMIMMKKGGGCDLLVDNDSFVHPASTVAWLPVFDFPS